MKNWLNKLSNLWENISNRWIGDVYIERDTEEIQQIETDIEDVQSDSNDFLLLQRICRDAVMEPFEGKQSLVIMQKTMSGLDRGLNQVKEKSASAWKKIGSWKDDANLVLPDIKSKSPGMMSGMFQKAERLTSELKSSIENSWDNLEKKTKEYALKVIKDALEHLVKKDTEIWVTKKASSILNRSDIQSLEDMQKLTSEERIQLIATLYPFDTTVMAGFTKTLDKTANITMGVVVATNIPGTGLAMSLLNMAKTWIRLANRVQSLSIIHGQKVNSAEKLFKLCALLMDSMIHWENTRPHTPLSPGIIGDLYTESADSNDEWFQELMRATLKKDAYIAVPGVGMISLSKIDQDEMKLDLMVHHLIENYFDTAYLKAKYDETILEERSELLKSIYQEFLNTDFFTLKRKQLRSEANQTGLKSRLKKMLGDEELDKKISEELDLQVHLIAHEIMEEGSDTSQIKSKIQEKMLR